MKRVAAILIMLTCLAHGQTYLTVTAETNRTIRTNFTISSQQVIGLSNIITNIAASNISGLITVAQGGTGASNSTAALVNLLPSYTGNSNMVLGLNSNATQIIWTTNGGSGGGGVGIDTRISSLGGVNLATYGSTNFSTNDVGAGFAAGAGSVVTNSGAAVGNFAQAGKGFAGGDSSQSHDSAVAIGESAFATNGGGAVGQYARSRGGGFGGGSNVYAYVGAGAIGKGAEAYAGGGAVGRDAIVAPSGTTNTSSTNTSGGGAVGALTYAETGFAGGNRADASGSGAAVGSSASTDDGVAIGPNASSDNGVALGANAVASGTTAFQIGAGDNDTDDTLQFLSAGKVDTNKWSALANAGIIGTNLLQATNTESARSILQLGTAATNSATAFQLASSNLTELASGDGSSLTNVTITDASTLTNFPSELLRTNGNASALTNFPSFLLRTNGDGSGLSNISVDLTAVLPAYSNNAGKVLAVAAGATNVEWTAVSNTVTDASSLTNFPAYILQTNSPETNFPSFLARTTNLAASNVTGILAVANGGTGTNTPVGARINLLPSYTGNSNKVLAVNAGESDVAWITPSTGSGSVTSVDVSGGTTGLTSSGGPITNSGTITIGGALNVANGGTGATNAANALTNILPSYSGNALRVLALNSNATSVVWAVDGGGSVSLTNTNQVTGILPLASGGTGASAATNALENLGIYELSSVRIKLGWSLVNNASTSLISIGRNTTNNSPNSIVIGYSSSVGTSANGSVVVGESARSTAGEASALGGYSVASATSSMQLGRGTNSTASTIQFLNAGSVNTNEWTALANLSTQGAYAMTNTAGISGTKTFVAYDGTNYTTNTVTISNGIITGWTP